jgi:hypothetical protein
MMMLKTFISIALLVGVDAWGYCNDNDVSCANWAKGGECTKDHVRKLCPHSCSICTHICRDTDTQCPQWKDSGECENNMDFMYNSCPVSCGVCKVTCYDKDASCPAWARDGECQKNKGLYTTCPVSCGTCTEVCLDKHNDCPSWAADGQCGTNAGFMLKTCPHSCNVCDEKSHAASSHPVGDVNMVTPDGRKITERAACADHDRNQCLICARPSTPRSLWHRRSSWGVARLPLASILVPNTLLCEVALIFTCRCDRG